MATITLPAGSTSDDLQAAINQIGSDDVIELSGNVEFSGTVTVPVGLSITIQSTAGNRWLMEQNAAGRHFSVLGSLTLSNIAVSGNVSVEQAGTTGGLQVFGSLNLTSGAVVQACYSGSGGGLFVESGGTLRVTGGLVTGNAAQNQGGGIYVDGGGTMYMSGGTIEGNRMTFDSGSGGGVSVAAGGYFEMSDGLITRNTLSLTAAQGGVGGGVCASGGEFVMVGGTISYNQSIQYGAGVGVRSGGTFTMSGGFIENNLAETAGGGQKLNGGGVAIIRGTTNMSGGTISGNEAVFGGGVYLGYIGTICRFDMTGGTIEGNFASAYGGGIHSQNEGSSIGIGESGSQAGTPVIRNNQSAYYGGGISVYNSAADIESGTIDGNSAANGGGVYVSGQGTCRIDDVTIAGNEARFFGGGIFTESYDYSDPASTLAYQNISTSQAASFTGNKANGAYIPPENAESFLNIKYLTTSIAGTLGYVHPLNNYDINYVGARALVLYSVAYDANGGTGSHGDTGIPKDTEYSVLSQEETGIERSGYVFAGWNTAADGRGTAYQPGDIILITGNVILYAQWTLIEGPYDVIYDANGGTGSYRDTGIPNGASYTVLPSETTQIERFGYTFVGWNRAADGSGTAYQPGDVIAITENVILYAQWEMAGGSYRLLYCPNCPCCCDRYNRRCCIVVGLSFNTAYTILWPRQAAICCPCHIFTGWNTQPDGSGENYLPGNIVLITGELILYGQWVSCWGRIL